MNDGINEDLDNVNYRQIGRSKSGKLLKGPSSSLVQVKTVPSIPGKFETVLNTGPKENKAFGGTSKRFETVENECPGPGGYSISRSLLSKSDSLSKKGYGNGFVSKTQRFSVEYQKIPWPSPGTYNIPKVDKKAISEFGTSSFLSTGKNANNEKSKPEIGPGTYEVKILSKSRSALIVPKYYKENLSPKVSLGPGEYSTLPNILSKSNSGVMMKSKSNRILPIVEQTSAGPGSYNIENALLPHIPTRVLQLSKSERFIETTNHYNSNLGPGIYDIPVDRNQRAAISVFKSNSERLDTKIPEVPGPCYYTPVSPTKKSFHLNSSQQHWLNA